MTEALHILLDPAHWIAEVAMDGVFALTVGRAAIWWHDRRRHPLSCGRRRRWRYDKPAK